MKTATLKTTCPGCGHKAALEAGTWTPCRCGAEGQADGLGGAEWRNVKMKSPHRNRRKGAPRAIPPAKKGRR